MDLLCEEDISWSPWIQHMDHPFSSSGDHTISGNYSSTSEFFLPCVSVGPLEDIELEAMLEKEVEYMPPLTYSEKLLQFSSIRVSRNAAIKWLIEAQHHFNFRTLTTTLAVNYLDQYLAKNISKAWTTWMFELLSIACLSIAAKMEEVYVPTLLDLQIGSMENTFDPLAVQRMELLILTSLQWKLSSITSASFVELMLSQIDTGMYHQRPSSARIADLILTVSSDVKFVQFRPSIIAAALVCHAMEKVVPVCCSTARCSAMAKSIIHNNESQFADCYKLLEDLIVDPVSSQSPNLRCRLQMLTSELTSSSPPSMLTSTTALPFRSSVHLSSSSADKKQCLATMSLQSSTKFILSHVSIPCESPLSSFVINHDENNGNDNDNTSDDLHDNCNSICISERPVIAHSCGCVMTSYDMESRHQFSSSSSSCSSSSSLSASDDSPDSKDCLCLYVYTDATRKRKRDGLLD